MQVPVDLSKLIALADLTDLLELSEATIAAIGTTKRYAIQYTPLPNGESSIESIKRIRQDHPEWTLMECKRIVDYINRG